MPIEIVVICICFYKAISFVSVFPVCTVICSLLCQSCQPAFRDLSVSAFVHFGLVQVLGRHPPFGSHRSFYHILCQCFAAFFPRLQAVRVGKVSMLPHLFRCVSVHAGHDHMKVPAENACPFAYFCFDHVYVFHLWQSALSAPPSDPLYVIAYISAHFRFTGRHF